jgi:hypothetical protein
VIHCSPFTCSPFCLSLRRADDPVAQSGAFGALADPGVLQRGGPDGPVGRGVHRDAAHHRLCRRGRGAVPVRGHDARHRLSPSCVRASMRYLPFGVLIAMVLLAEIIVAVGAWSAGRLNTGRRIAPMTPTCPTSRRSAACSTRATLRVRRGGLVLLVAMIGAIVLTHRPAAVRKPERRQADRRRPRTRYATSINAVGQGVEL